MSLSENAPAHHDVKFFLPDEVEVVVQLIALIRAHKDTFVQQWRELCASLFRSHLGAAEQLFQEMYVPDLRSAVLRLGGGDAEGFAAFSAILGQHLAAADVPFAALVTHLNVLKESCVSVVAGQMGEMSRPMRLTLDKLTACCVSAAADGYYRRVNGPACTVATPARAAEALSTSVPPLRGLFHGMVGRSPAMQRVFEQFSRLAPGAAPVLVAGETGTGKELIARAIHNAGPRRGGPFVAVKCAALPGELIESELFGYKRGAFSGAVSDHLGLFRAAVGGTLLLDEITEMSHEMQAKLLRVVQERSVRPVGSVTEVPVDVHIIASTNRDPQDIVAHRVLRSDLYYRLCVSMVMVPPLRERGDDILLLVEYHLGVLNQRYGHAVHGVRGVTADAMVNIIARDWPGNVRELFNVLEDAFTACPSLHITPADLPFRPLPAEPAGAAPDPDTETFAAGERALIERALSATRGNKLRAARHLGISRKKLYAKLAKYTLPILLLSPMVSASAQAPVGWRAARLVPACGRAIATRSSRVFPAPRR